MSASAPLEPGCRIALLATGGTLEKRYDPHTGTLALGAPVVEELLATLVQPDVAVDVERVMAVDSLDMDDAGRDAIVAAVARRIAAGGCDAVIVTHGTDTLAETASALVAGLKAPAVPVVLTGAMVPWACAGSDAAQNLAQALMAARLLAPGVHVVFHSRVVPGERVVKDYARLTLVDGRPG